MNEWKISVSHDMMQYIVGISSNISDQSAGIIFSNYPKHKDSTLPRNFAPIYQYTRPLIPEIRNVREDGYKKLLSFRSLVADVSISLYLHPTYWWGEKILSVFLARIL